MKTKSQSLTFALISQFGRQFSFNAISLEDAISKAKGWCRYHSLVFEYDGYSVKQCGQSDADDLHNEYID